MIPHELAIALAKPTHVCDKADLEACRRICEVSKQWLRSNAESWLAARCESPVLVQYCSDCTPLQTRQQYRSELDQLKVHRQGKRTGEYLVERLFLCDTDFKPIVMFSEPVKLADKTQWSHLQACRNLFSSAREAGHKGLCISHHIWDGAVKSSMERLRKQFFEAMHHHHTASLGPEAAHRLKLLHWDTYVPCKAHECHNSLKWGVFKYIEDKSTLKNAYITMESLRNAFDELETNCRPWIRSCLHYEDWGLDCISELWTVLGISGEWLETLVELQLRFESGMLLVASAFEGNPDTENLVYHCMMHLWQFSKFTDSRWVTLGCASRSLLASTLVGLHSLVQHIMSNPASSSYYIRGFGHFDQKVHELVGIVSTSSFVADSVLQLLLEDDRVPRNIESIDNELIDEVNFVFNISSGVWRTLASACNMSEGELQDACISSALVQAGFITGKFREARKPPWNLLQGNKHENLDALSQQPRPSDETAGKIWELLQKEYDRQELLNGLALLEEVGWCSTTVEQGHVKASRLMQKHREYTEDTMRCRAMVGSMTPLLTATPDEKK
jgi:hypothetical protein